MALPGSVLVPLTFNVTEQEANLAEECAEQLDAAGLIVERMGQSSVVVREVPVLWRRQCAGNGPRPARGTVRVWYR